MMKGGPCADGVPDRTDRHSRISGFVRNGEILLSQRHPRTVLPVGSLFAGNMVLIFEPTLRCLEQGSREVTVS